jgi:uncharacterized surface protein with fasciclin (FAS1) repeats
MRSRHLAVLPAAVVLVFFAAGCGKKATPAATPVPTAVASAPTSPNAPNDGSSNSNPSGTSSGGSSSGSSSSGGSSSGGSTTPPEAPNKKAKPGETIPIIAARDDDLTNLTTAVGAANLTKLLSQPGQYTFFAPNNDGFAKLGTQLDTLLQPSSQAQLATILKFHIVKGRYSTKQLHNGELLLTLQGTRMRVYKKGDQISIGNKNGKAQIVDSDIDASNGVIHVVDTVLQPVNVPAG